MMPTKSDLLGQCNDWGIPMEEFTAAYCALCSNPVCVRSKYKDAATQRKIEEHRSMMEFRIDPSQVDPEYQAEIKKIDAWASDIYKQAGRSPRHFHQTEQEVNEVHTVVRMDHLPKPEEVVESAFDENVGDAAEAIENPAPPPDPYEAAEHELDEFPLESNPEEFEEDEAFDDATSRMAPDTAEDESDIEGQAKAMKEARMLANRAAMLRGPEPAKASEPGPGPAAPRRADAWTPPQVSRAAAQDLYREYDKSEDDPWSSGYKGPRTFETKVGGSVQVKKK